MRDIEIQRKRGTRERSEKSQKHISNMFFLSPLMQGLILHICALQMRLPAVQVVNNRCRVSEYNPNHQMSGISDHFDASSYKHSGILPEQGEMKKISDNIAVWAFY